MGAQLNTLHQRIPILPKTTQQAKLFVIEVSPVSLFAISILIIHPQSLSTVLHPSGTRYKAIVFVRHLIAPIQTTQNLLG